jgi:hypothetical protein
MGAIPVNGFANTILEGDLRSPEFARILSHPVCNHDRPDGPCQILHQGFGLAEMSQNRLDDDQVGLRSARERCKFPVFRRLD